MSVPIDLIPLAGASVVLGRTVNAGRLMADRGKFPVPVYRRGRYRECSRAEVAAELARRPHLTRAEYGDVAAALADGVPIPTSENPAVAELTKGAKISAAGAARALGLTPIRFRTALGRRDLPFVAVQDPSHPTRKLFDSREVAAYLVSLSPVWPSAECLAAVPELDLDGVRRTLADDFPAVTAAYLRAREAVSLADYAAAAGVSLNTIHARAQRGAIPLVPSTAATGTRRAHRRVPSAWVAAELGIQEDASAGRR